MQKGLYRFYIHSHPDKVFFREDLPYITIIPNSICLLEKRGIIDEESEF